MNMQKNKIVDLAKGNIPTNEPMVEPNKPMTDTPLNGQPMMDDSTEKFKEIMSAGLFSATQAHIFHLQVSGAGSFAAHMALNTFYDEVPGIIDGLVESYQGKYGIITGYKNYDYKDFTSVDEVIGFLTQLETMIETNRTGIKESYIQNQLDTFVELINSTLYKLKNLQ